jgi:hypothetical protein
MFFPSRKQFREKMDWLQKTPPSPGGVFYAVPQPGIKLPRSGEAKDKCKIIAKFLNFSGKK